MAVGSLNSTFDYSTMQVIQSAQNKERLQRQQQADKAGTAAPDSAVSAKRTESLKQAQTPVGSVQGQSRQPQQSAAQSQNTARPAADNPSASSPEQQLNQYQAQNKALQADHRPQSKALAAYSAVAAQSQRDGLSSYFSFSVYA